MASSLEVATTKRRRFEIGSAPPEFCTEPKDYYRCIYFEGLDLLVQLLLIDLTSQDIIHIYAMLKAVKKEDFSNELTTVCNLYGSDLHTANLNPACIEVLAIYW